VSVAGAQTGPVDEPQLAAALLQGLLTEGSFVWNPSLPSWVPLNSIPELLFRLRAAQPPKPDSASMGVKVFPDAPVRSRPKPMGAAIQPGAALMAAGALTSPLESSEEKTLNSSGKFSLFGISSSGVFRSPAEERKPAPLPPAEEKPGAVFKKGDWIWVKDPVEAIIPGRVSNFFSNGGCQVELLNKHVKNVSKSDFLGTLNPANLEEEISDLVMLEDLSPAFILYTLKNRFLHKQIYTYVGTILVSVNPYERLAIYSPQIMENYRNRGVSELPPHIFVTADNAFQRMIDLELSQSIIISGESGAGKTEATKQCLQYIAEFSGSDANVEQRILSANPVLEAFGNSKTVRNNNSSRFGKYIEIFFDRYFQICGAQNTNYLLEKVRVVKQSAQERNFHIFFQLCLGASAEQRDRWKLKHPKSFTYLNSTDSIEIEDVDDAHDFIVVQDALKGLNIDSSETDEVFQVVAAILHLGNIEFKDVGDRKCEIHTLDSLNTCASLLSLDPSDLSKALTSKVFKVPGKERDTGTIISLSSQESADSRDALSKFLYDKLFDWLVHRVNRAFGSPKEKCFSIGILDIFGFEVFQVNSFEQLCINYTNEKLQQNFNATTFAHEEQLYIAEGIDFTSVQYVDNQPVLDLIEKVNLMYISTCNALHRNLQVFCPFLMK